MKNEHGQLTPYLNLIKHDLMQANKKNQEHILNQAYNAQNKIEERKNIKLEA